MPYQKVRVPVLRVFVPREAHSIAAQLRAAVGPVRAFAQQLRKIDGTLDATWEGNSKNRFSEGYEPELGRTEDLAGSVEHVAGQIASMSVSVWETQEEEVWVPDAPVTSTGD